MKLDARASAHADSDEGARAKRRRERITLISGRLTEAVARRPQLRSEAVCVRLCDGYFFPLPVAAYDTASQATACNSLCPDAPTDVYYRNRSDQDRRRRIGEGPTLHRLAGFAAVSGNFGQQPARAIATASLMRRCATQP